MSNDHNNVIMKNPLATGIVVVVIIGIIVLIVKMRGTEEAFSQSDTKNIVENFPQSVPMNVMYSDSNGNLGTTTDLGLQHLTVKGESSFGGSATVGGMIDTPSINRNSGDWLRVNDQGASVGQTAMYGGVCINDTRQAHGGLSVGDWNANVGQGNIHATGRVLAGKNLQTIRNRVCFSNGLDDPNHSIYNNGYNIDGEGGWDGLKMNVYSGLDVRTGNANGVVPKNVLSVRDDQVNVNAKMNIHAGGPWAIPNGKMSNGSMTIGDIYKNFGGGSGFSENTAGLMMECADKTEIAVHDAGTRVASAMYYDGPANTISIGRDMGWGVSNVSVGGSLNVANRNILAELDALKADLKANYIRNQDNINLYYPTGNEADVKYDMYLGTCNPASCGGGWAASFGRHLAANHDNFKIRVKKI